MKKDLESLLGAFTTEGFKVGDLVITGEIHRITSLDSCGGVEVSTLLPKCSVCKGECKHHRIMDAGHGQQKFMKLKEGY